VRGPDPLVTLELGPLAELADGGVQEAVDEADRLVLLIDSAPGRRQSHDGIDGDGETGTEYDTAEQIIDLVKRRRVVLPEQA
jgi:hypothetical protein